MSNTLTQREPPFHSTTAAPRSKHAVAATSSLAGSLTIGLLVLRPQGKIVVCNPTMARLLGYIDAGDIVQRSIDSLLEDMQWEALRPRNRDVDVTSLSMRHENGGSVHLTGDIHVKRDKAGTVTGYELLLVDVTEKRQLETALQKAARTEALWALTGGIAHDFNNLLTVIVGNLYLLVENLRDNALVDKVKTARDAARRGADLTKQLLSFARQKTAEAQTVRLPVLIQNLKLLLERTLGQKIQLTTRVATDSWPVQVDVTQLESALINLAVNARDAMDGAGTITIGVENVRLGDEAAKRAGTTPGEYVRIYVSDSGPGIPAEVRARIFEPFFTTKGERGSGLGLSMVRRMMKSAGGTVAIDSTEGNGATFELLFPKAEEPEAQTVDMTQPLSTLPTGTEKVLVLCADADISTTIEQSLGMLGYTVATATKAAAAREQLAHGGMDLLLSEQTLTHGESVEELITLGRDRAPDLRVLLISADAAAGALPDTRIQGLLRKPFSLAELAKRVRGALDEG